MEILSLDSRAVETIRAVSPTLLGRASQKPSSRTERPCLDQRERQLRPRVLQKILRMSSSPPRGYADSVNTAKVLASYGPRMSRLGFTGQYTLDAIAVAGPLLIVGRNYHSGFIQVLEGGESEAGAS